MMFVGGVDLKWFVLGVAALAAGVVVVVMIPGVIQYAQSRLEYWLDPFADPQGPGVSNHSIAIGHWIRRRNGAGTWQLQTKIPLYP